MLSVANCQLELKDIKAARKTLAEVAKTYPQTEAAVAASERLTKLK
jgi:TolA-binding protein